jgi:hypothetical protein
MRWSLPVRVLVSFTLVWLFCAGPAPAEEEAKAPAKCRQAVDELCPDSKPGTPERRACVRANADKLPEDCRVGAPRGGQAGVQAMMSACEGDIEAHCKNVRRGGGRLVKCLRGVDEGKLTSACTEQLDTMAGRGPGRPAPAAPPEPAKAP